MRTVLTLILAAGCASAGLAQTIPDRGDATLWARALKIHRKAIVVDGHNDVTGPLVDEDLDLSTNTVGKYHRDGDPFHTDIARLRASGITGEFFSIYVSGSTLRTGGSMRRAMDMIDATYREVERHPGDLSICATAAEIRRAKKAKKICALMGIEGG